MQSKTILMLSVIAAVALIENRFVSPMGGMPTAGGNTLGVVESDAAAGEITPVAHLGTAVVEASAAIAKGAAIETLADGRAVTADAGIVVARALEAAAAAGQLIEVTLIPN